MSLLKQLLSDLKHCPEYFDHMSSYFELPNRISIQLAQIRFHPEFETIKEQVQMMRPRPNTCVPEPPVDADPLNPIDLTAPYRCHHPSCQAQAPYKTLGRFRNHMSSKHPVKDSDSSTFQITRASDGPGLASDHSHLANLPISTGALSPGASFSSTFRDSSQRPSPGPMRPGMLHAGHHHGHAGQTPAQGSLPPQSNLGFGTPHYHTTAAMNDATQGFTHSQLVTNPNQPKYQYNGAQTNAATNRSGPAYDHPQNNKTTPWNQ